MYRHNHAISKIMLLSMIFFSFSGCTRYGKLNDGNSIIEVSFDNIPSEFYQFNDSAIQDFTIQLELVNLTTDKHYLVKLTKNNDYSQVLHLEDGNYEVLTTEASLKDIFGIEAACKQDTIVASMDSVAYISVQIANMDEFKTLCQGVNPRNEIIESSIFSRKLQMHGKMISTQSLLSELEIDSTKTLLPFESVSIKDSKNKISLTLYNPYDTAVAYRDCQVQEYTVYGNSVVLPGGITIGIDTESVCNSKNGIYGDPTGFSGNLLYGMGVNDLSTNIVYTDSLSGDVLTLTTDRSGEYITEINYKLHTNPN